MKKSIVVCIICLLMLINIPMVSGETIHFPKEEGPYTVFASGELDAISGGISTIFRIIPFWFLFSPRHICYHFEGDSVLFVNGEKQDIVYPAKQDTVYPAQVDLIGFKGYGQTFHLWSFKIFASNIIYSLTDFLRTPKARVIGQCNEIIVFHNYSGTL